MSGLPRIGEVFEDRFEIQELLGTGGNGTVFKAFQTDCQRAVALKILRPEAAVDEEYRARFFREAQTLNRLNHLNIVTVFYMGISPSNQPYLVMEYVEGESLRQRINNAGNLPLLEALKIARDCAKALAYVHKHDLVHRDLKPENIMLTKEPEPDTVKIVDFGLVRLTAPTAPTEQQLTSTSQLIGTPKYMSPEQCLGKKPDFRTDIYALSLCLYEMLTGKAPFDADTAVGLMYKHINETAPRLTLATGTSVELSEIINRGMCKDPDGRFSSMEELCAKIDEAISILKSARTPANNNLLVRSITGLLFVSVALLGASHWFFRRQLTSPALHKPAGHIEQKKGRSNIEAEGLLRLIAAARKSGDPKQEAELPIWERDLAGIRLSQRRFEEADSLLADALERKEKEVGKNSPYLSPILKAMMASLQKQNRLQEAEDKARRRLAIEEKACGTDDPSIAVSLFDLAECCITQGNYSEASVYLKRALAICPQPCDFLDEAAFQKTVLWLAQCYDSKQMFAEEESLLSTELKEQHYTSVLDINAMQSRFMQDLPLVSHEKNRVPAKNSRAVKTRKTRRKELNFELLIQLGTCQLRQKKLQEAESTLLDGLSLGEKEHGSTDLRLSHAHLLLGETFEQEGKLEKAEKELKKAISISSAHLPITAAELSQLKARLGNHYRDQKRYAEAEQAFGQALDIARENKLQDINQTAWCLRCLSMCYTTQGRNSEAIKVLEEALAPYDAPSADRYLKASNAREGLIDLLNELGRLLAAEKRFGYADTVVRRAISIAEKMPAATAAPYLIRSMHLLSESLLRQNKSAEAELLSKHALDLARKIKTQPANDLLVASCLFQLCAVYLNEQRPQQALPAEQEALRLRQKHLPPNSEELLWTYVRLVECFEQLHRFDEQETLLKKILDLRQARPDEPYLSRSMFDLARFYGVHGKIELARPLLKKALLLAPAASGDHHLDDIIYNTANGLVSSSYYGAAKPLLEYLMLADNKPGRPPGKGTGQQPGHDDIHRKELLESCKNLLLECDRQARQKAK